jgi:transcriptional regulator with XRE-family HTH domain
MTGEPLKLLRIMNEIKSKDLAEQLGISPSYLSLIENNKKRPTLEIVEKYAEVFKMKPSSIVFLMEDFNDSSTAGKIKNGTQGVFMSMLKKLQKFGDLYDAQ